MRRAWLFTAILVPVLFAALPLATLFVVPSSAVLEPEAVTITVTAEPDAVAMRPAGAEPQRDCSYESNLHIES